MVVKSITDFSGWFFFSVLQGSVAEYCLHNCKVAPVVIVPGKGIMLTPFCSLALV